MQHLRIQYIFFLVLVPHALAASTADYTLTSVRGTLNISAPVFQNTTILINPSAPHSVISLWLKPVLCDPSGNISATIYDGPSPLHKPHPSPSSIRVSPTPITRAHHLVATTSSGAWLALACAGSCTNASLVLHYEALGLQHHNSRTATSFLRTCTISHTGSIFCWGLNRADDPFFGNPASPTGFLGIADTSPTVNVDPARELQRVAIDPALTVHSVHAAAHGFTAGEQQLLCALADNGTKIIWWGASLYNQFSSTASAQLVSSDFLTPFTVSPAGRRIVQLKLLGNTLEYALVLALYDDGVIRYWGKHYYSPGGNPTDIQHAAEVPFPTNIHVVKFDAAVSTSGSKPGFFSLCAIDTQGDVYCYGYNKYSNLIFRESDYSRFHETLDRINDAIPPTPAKQQGGSPVVDIAMWGNSAGTMVVYADGHVRNYGQQLYDGNSVRSNSDFPDPAVQPPVPYLSDFNVSSVVCDHIKFDHFNYPDLPQESVPTCQDATSAGTACESISYHCCFRGRTTGASVDTARCAGLNIYGETGTAYSRLSMTVNRTSTQPARVADLPLEGGWEVADVFVGPGMSCVQLKHSTAQVICFGLNIYYAAGLLTQREITSVADLSPVPAFRERTLIDVCAGSLHVCAIYEQSFVSGSQRLVKCFGANSNGQLGTGDSFTHGQSASSMGNNLPSVQLPPGEVPVALRCTGDTTCLLAQSGRIYCWGNGRHTGVPAYANRPAVGLLPSDMGANMRPVALPANNLAYNASLFGCSSSFCCVAARNASGPNIFCWGRGEYLGTLQGWYDIQLAVAAGKTATSAGKYYPRTTDSHVPRAEVNITQGDEPARLHVTENFACVRLVSTKLWCWGQNHDSTKSWFYPLLLDRVAAFMPPGSMNSPLGTFAIEVPSGMVDSTATGMFRSKSGAAAAATGYTLAANGTLYAFFPGFGDPPAQLPLNTSKPVVDVVTFTTGLCVLVGGTKRHAECGVYDSVNLPVNVNQRPVGPDFIKGSAVSGPLVKVPLTRPLVGIYAREEPFVPASALKGKYLFCARDLFGGLQCMGDSPGNGFYPFSTGTLGSDYGAREEPAVLTACSEGREGSTCTRCVAGTHSVITRGRSVCQDCPPGTFGTFPGRATQAEACFECPAGTFSLEGSTSCTKCPVGTYRPLGGANCTACPLGTFSAIEGASSCSPCAQGTFTATTGAFTCTLCTLGTYSNRTGTAVECTPCAPGTYQDVEGQSSCKACQPGSYQALPEQAACVQCAPGSHQPAAGANNCSLPCPAGTFSASGARECTPCQEREYNNQPGQSTCFLCAPGTFSDTTGLTRCKDCSPGLFASTNGSLSCTPCARGSYASSAAATTCVECAAGTVQPSLASTTCASCTSGTYQPLPGQASCIDCSPGRYSNVTGASACDSPCAAGTFSTGRALSCTACPVGQFSGVGRAACAACLDGETNAVNSSACVPCPVGEFGVSGTCRACDQTQGLYNPSPGATSCRTCPANSESTGIGCRCLADFYSLLGATQECIACPRQATCFGGAGGSSSIRAKDGFFQDPADPTKFVTCSTACSSASSTGCVSGHTGLLCAKCITGYGKISGACVQCGPQWIQVVGLALGVLAVVFYVLFFVKKSLRRKSNSGIALKLLLNHLQMLAFASDLPLGFPTSIRDFLSASQVSTADPTGYSLECSAQLDFVGQYTVTLLLPVFAAVLGVLLAIGQFVSRTMGKNWLGENADVLPISNFWLNIRRFTVTTIFLIHPIVTKRAFSVYECVELQGAMRMKADLAVVCGESLHTELVVVSSLVIVFFSFGWPVFLFFVLRKHHANPSSTTINAYTFLSDGFKPELYFWEMLVILRKLLFVLAIVFGSGDTFNTTVTTMIIVQAALLGHALFSPYMRVKLNWMELGSLVVVFTNQALGLYFLTDKLRVESGQTTLMDTATSITLTIILFAANIGLLLFFVYVALTDKTKASRWRSTKIASLTTFVKQSSMGNLVQRMSRGSSSSIVTTPRAETQAVPSSKPYPMPDRPAESPKEQSQSTPVRPLVLPALKRLPSQPSTEVPGNQ